MNLSNENMVHVKNGDVEYLQFRKLLDYSDKIKHCYTLRPLDFKLKSKEDENFVSISNALGFDNLNIVKPKQTHTDIVLSVFENSKSEDFDDVDGLVTDVKNKFLSCVFADCTPFLLYDPIKNIVGNIHSGWKGTVKKIGKVAIQKMVNEYGSNPKDIICCIGPAIRVCHFEVEEDVKDLFVKAFNDGSIIKKGDIIDGKQKYFIDTMLANKKMFEELGLLPENIIDSCICTVCNNDILHSYRAMGDEAGRNTSIIGLY